jgi:hypothetical protein
MHMRCVLVSSDKARFAAASHVSVTRELETRP